MTEAEVTAYWHDFHMLGVVDSVLVLPPTNYYKLCWMSSVAFLSDADPATVLDLLRRRADVMAAAPDDLFGPAALHEVPKGGFRKGQFYEERWPYIEGMVF